MKKAANKIALIIVALLVVSLGVFSTINYMDTKGNIYDLAKETKTSASKLLQFYMNAFFTLATQMTELLLVLILTVKDVNFRCLIKVQILMQELECGIKRLLQKMALYLRSLM